MKKTRRALFCSFVAMILCLSMLVGTTFAWFTDEVVSANNIIKSGTLDVEMYWAEGTEDPQDSNTVWADASEGAIFDYDLWEPGYTEVRHVKIVNAGSLALKYELDVIANGEVSELADVIDVYFVDPAVQVADRTALDGVSPVGTLTEVLAGMPTNVSGELLPEGNADGKPNEVIVTIALKMQESANNDYQNLSIGSDFAVQLIATQLTYEEDSFDNEYDKEAVYPAHIAKAHNGMSELTLTVGDITVVVPAAASAGFYQLNVASYSETVDENDEVIVDSDFALTKDGEAADPNAVYEVRIQIDPMSTINGVYHKDEEITETEYVYDPFTGVISFTTSSFSPFSVDYTVFGKEVKLEGESIQGGFFKGVNPATLDESLAAADSEYIAVDYKKDGVKWYAVSERATTVIVDDGEESAYVFENGDYTELVKTNQSGKLYSVISGLQNNANSTVYIMPGTYNEATTIYVYSSMDIIGLGDIEETKIVKTSSSDSNRHLFNCSGTKADYIEVTIRNMTLNATAKTTNSKDNAAVQSIRKSKVKCYDLDIIKDTGWDAVAFYVNGNNKVDGVKYPAYMYVENCTLNTTRSFGVVTTSGSYKFYHNGLTYGGNEYTNNSGSIKNVVLEWNDWDW